MGLLSITLCRESTFIARRHRVEIIGHLHRTPWKHRRSQGTLARDVWRGSRDSALRRHLDRRHALEPDPQAVAHATPTMPVGIIAGGDATDEERDYPLEGTGYPLRYTTGTTEDA